MKGFFFNVVGVADWPQGRSFAVEHSHIYDMLIQQIICTWFRNSISLTSGWSLWLTVQNYRYQRLIISDRVSILPRSINTQHLRHFRLWSAHLINDKNTWGDRMLNMNCRFFNNWLLVSGNSDKRDANAYLLLEIQVDFSPLFFQIFFY